ncbi:hypothetical protein FNV43_RR25434 [Rhamnella rubrinervis]|uniref:Toll-like receptor 3 n=1 Tax=Rhamnella rubrinervis TaxID=2594499 RepID=A0A8K0DPM9_9ROSA|nr:hypothetical protein FNV43_RR25434 [Rhamnella rubrinervis]
MDVSNNLFHGLLPTEYVGNFLATMHDGRANKLEYMGEGCSFIDYYQDSVTVTMKGSEKNFEKILKIFMTTDFSKNNFDGEIPEVVGILKSLKGLNLSHNKLWGHIPTSLRNLGNLEWLDLSSNNLYGTIPDGNQFNTFGNDLYIGNLGLYGFPLMKTCWDDEAQPPSPSANDDEEAPNGFHWKYVYMGYGSGLVIGISVGYMFFSDERLAYLTKKVGGGEERGQIMASGEGEEIRCLMENLQ